MFRAPLNLSKARILEAYLNEIYLGQQGGQAVHGVAAASEFYYGHDLAAANLPEIALLIGLIQGPSVLDPRCHTRLVLDRIADKWTALVIQILAGGTMRYAALQREIGGISQKMLTQTLRSLERDGLVQRTVHPVVPPKVEYSLTKLGRTLIEPLQGLCRWSEKHLGELQANRARAKETLAMQ